MRAGAREYFTLPLVPAEVAGALTRASIPQAAPVHQAPKTNGQVFVFLGSKGGCGVTSIAANFSLSVAMESSQPTLLIDLGQPLGDAAINLGMVSNYSVANALRDHTRLDGSLLNTLLAKHESGLQVLAAPSEFPKDQPPLEAFDKLLTVARQNFNYVVIDAGSRIDLMDSSLFEESSTVYLITQVGISELRNSNRLISQYFSLRGRSLQIVLNRYTANTLLFDDAPDHQGSHAARSLEDSRRLLHCAQNPELGHSHRARRLTHLARHLPDGQDGLRLTRRKEAEKRLQPLRKIRVLTRLRTLHGTRRRQPVHRAIRLPQIPAPYPSAP